MECSHWKRVNVSHVVFIAILKNFYNQLYPVRVFIILVFLLIHINEFLFLSGMFFFFRRGGGFGKAQDKC